MAKFLTFAKKYKYYFLITILSLAAGFALAEIYFHYKVIPKLIIADYNNITVHQIHSGDNPYPYINPLLGFDVGEHQPSPEYQTLQQQISQTITAAKDNGQVTDVAVYFRDLQTGRWTGVNETEKFAPGSIMKVALMIAYYKTAEDDPGILTKQLSWDGQDDANQSENIQPPQSIKPNEPYSVDDLIRYMIVDSDNNAANLLLNNYDPSALTEVFGDLMVNAPITDSTGDVISPKQLSLMFRLLYNATYLSDEMSNKALELLADSAYKNGLAAGLPGDVKVADKFGERTIEYPLVNNDVVEFHNCGIVYFPGHPYFLCVMSKGVPGSLGILQQTAAQISTVVYNQIKQIYR